MQKYHVSSKLSGPALSYAAGAVTALVGLLALIGWQFDVAVLKTFHAGSVSMKANTSAAFLLAGIALILLRRTRPITKTLVRFFALIIALVGLLTLCEYLFGWNPGIDQMLFRESGTLVATSNPGRMAPNTAINFLLLGLAFFVLGSRRFRSGFLAEFPLVFSLTISVIGLVGYLTGLVELTGPAAYTQMATNTAGAFIILCIGMLATAYERQRAPITIEQKLFAGVTAAVVVIIFISFLSVSGIQSLLQASDWVEHTQKVKQELDLGLARVLDVETGARGFVLTGEESYTEPPNKAAQELPGILNNLRRLTSDNPRQQEALTSLQRLVTERIELSDQLVQTRRSKGLEEAISLFATGKGKMLTDSIRVLITQMLAEEDRLLQTRDAEEALRAERTRRIIYVSLGAQVLLLVFIFAAVNRDMTGRRKAEEALREKTDELDRYFTHTLDLLCIADMNGYFRRLNKAWESTLGYTLQDLEGKPFLDFVHPDDRSATLGAMADLSKGIEVLSFTNRYRHKDGSYRWIEWRSFPAGDLIYASARDITESKRAAEALKESEERLALVLDSGQMGAWDLDLIHDTAVRSLRHDQIFGYDSLLPQWGAEIFMKHVVPEDREQVQEKFKEAFTGGSLYFECRILRPDNVLRWIAARGRAYKNQEGTPVRMMGVVSDITDRKLAEEEIRRLLDSLTKQSAELDAANKELEAFSYSVSHDLRAPLRSIDGFSQALLKDYNDKLDDQGKDFLRRVRAASQRMAQLIDDMLKLSQITRAEMRYERVDLSGIAREIADELRETHPERRVEFILADGLIDNGDPELLRAVMANLLGNSWKYTGKKPAARIEFGATQHENKTAYYVRDNGVGFDMAYADKLFGAFQRLHSTTEFEGTGIGLATVQRIIHRHGGEIWTEAKKNEGATFYFSL